MHKKLLILGLLVLVMLPGLSSLKAQVTYDPNAEKFMLLSLNQSYIALGQAAKNFVRVKEQYENKLVSTEQFDQALAQYRNTKINYDMALMRILYNASTIIVERAVKRVLPDGSTTVTVRVKNDTGGSYELTKLRTAPTTFAHTLPLKVSDLSRVFMMGMRRPGNGD